MARGPRGSFFGVCASLSMAIGKPESYGAAPRRERSGPVDSAEHASVDVTADTITSAMYSAPPPLADDGRGAPRVRRTILR